MDTETFMPITIAVFGSLTDIVGTTEGLGPFADTNELIDALNKRYPDLRHSKYVIAVNKKMINSNTGLKENDAVALMPPFSGG